ncbi:MAG: hypothetical protein JO134_15435 [Xanthobacteraceae bacterium]|nr:hypothetical protein [Xanthobacteraceae bacterium]
MGGDPRIFGDHCYGSVHVRDQHRLEIRVERNHPFSSIQKEKSGPSRDRSDTPQNYSLALLVTALVLTTAALLATLAWTLGLLIRALIAAALLTTLLAALMLLAALVFSALIGIIRHDSLPFERLRQQDNGEGSPNVPN